MCVLYWMSTTLHCVSRHHDLAMSESFKCSSPFKGFSFIVVLFELLYNVINWLEIVSCYFEWNSVVSSVEGIFIFIEQSVDTFLTKSQDVGQDYSERWKSLKSWWVKFFKIHYDFKNSCNMILEIFDTHKMIVQMD